MRVLFCFFLLAGLSCTTEEDGGRRFRDGRKKTESKDRERESPLIKTGEGAEETSPTTTPSTSGIHTPPQSKRSLQTPPQEEKEDKKENTPFPVRLNTKHTSLLIEQESKTKALITAEPQANPVDLVARRRGELSISTQNGKHYLTLSLSDSAKTFHYDLSRSGTTLKMSHGQSVNPNDVLAKTTDGVIFYVKENGNPKTLCFSVRSMPEGIKIINNFPKHKNCGG